MSSAEQKDNTDLSSKIILRKWMLKEMGGADKQSVLELFAGMGHIHDAVYTDVKKHMGFELRKVNRPTWLQGDNRTLLRTRTNGWSVYDLDAYSNPWILANDICRLREPGKFAMVLTCGMNRPMLAGRIIGFMRQRAELNSLDILGCGLLYFFYFDVIRLMMKDWDTRHGVKVLKAKHIDSTATNWIHYFGVICEKAAPPQPTSVQLTAKPKAKASVFP